jgi:hypothetical protein
MRLRGFESKVRYIAIPTIAARAAASAAREHRFGFIGHKKPENRCLVPANSV